MPSKSTITVSAPANVMLFGEHAVLHGHGAIACALSPRIRVTLTPNKNQTVSIHSALGNFTAQIGHFNHHSHRQLSFVLASIQAVFSTTLTAQNAVNGLALTIESEFSHTVGLGSSAAVVAATVYALLLYKNQLSGNQQTIHKDSVFKLGLSAIHTVQGRGSGTDLAASVYGGMVGYTVAHKEKSHQVTPLLFNDSTVDYPTLGLFYCGYKTPTPEVISYVAKKHCDFPDIYDDLYSQMHRVTTKAEAVIQAQDWEKLGKLMNLYHGLMDALGVSDHTLSDLVYRARQKQSVLGAKISGSGLGDCIITLSSSTKIITDLVDTKNCIGSNITPYGIIHHDESTAH